MESNPRLLATSQPHVPLDHLTQFLELLNKLILIYRELVSILAKSFIFPDFLFNWTQSSLEVIGSKEIPILTLNIISMRTDHPFLKPEMTISIPIVSTTPPRT